MRRAVTPLALAGFYAAYLGALGIFWPFFGMHLRAVGLSEPEATAVMAVWPAAGFVAPPLIGLLADMFGARAQILRIVTVAALAGFAIFFVARGLAGMALATAVLALFRSAVLPMVDSLALDAEVRYGRIRAWGSLGFLVGALLGGRLIAAFDTRAMLVATIFALAPAVLLAFVMPAPPVARQPAAVADWLRLLGRPRLWSLLAATGLAQTGNSIYDAGFSLHLGRLGFGPNFVGVVWAVGVGGEVALMLLSPWLIDRIGAGWLFAGAVAVAALRWLVLSMVTAPLTLLVLSPLHGVSFGLFYVGAVSLARAEAKDDTRAAVQGLAAAAMAVGGTAGMLVAGRLLHDGGGQSMFGVAAASTTLAALLAAGRAFKVRVWNLGAEVRAAFARHRLRPDAGRVLVACSGGPDSRALLELLVENAAALDVSLSVAAVDHGRRAEAAAECAAVIAAASAHGLSATVLSLQTPPKSMAAARAARYQALVARAQSSGAEAIAVAHTATDQAETLLDRLLRGAGALGLSAMAPRRNHGAVAIIRPLLAVTRDEIEAFVAARRLDVARDPTNLDERYRRSRLRHTIMPLLRAERPDADLALAATAARLREDDQALEEAAAHLEPVALSDGEILLLSLATAPPAVVTRFLRRMSPVPLDAAHLAALRQLTERRNGSASIDLPDGVRALRVYDRLTFSTATTPAVPAEIPIDGPGSYRFGAVTVEVSAEAIARWPGTLILRPPRSGDRMVGHSRKLKRVLIDRKVPRADRAVLPTLVRRTMLGDETLWVAESPPPPTVVVS